jgi:hypothetical protein
VRNFKFVIRFILTFACLLTLSGIADASFTDDMILPYITVDTTKTVVSYPILSPLADGPLRVLFIGSGQTTGTICRAVSCRLDCRVESVLTPSRSMLGLPDGTDQRTPTVLAFPGIDALLPALDAMAIKRTYDLLQQTWDVVWLDYDFNALPGTMGKDILALVERGAGLVVVGDIEAYRNITANRKGDTRPFAPLKYESVRGMQVMKRGQGSIVIMPAASNKFQERIWGDYANTAAYAVFVASGRTFPIADLSIETKRTAVEQEVVGIMKFRTALINRASMDSVHFIVRGRDLNGRIISERSEWFSLKGKDASIAFPYPVVPIGTYSLDVTVMAGNVVVAFGGMVFSVDASERIADMRFWSPYAPRGGYVMGSVSLSMPIREGMNIKTTLEDDSGTVLEHAQGKVVAGRKTVDFIALLREYYPRIVNIVVEYYKNNECVERIRRPYIVSDSVMTDTFRMGVIDCAATRSRPAEQYRLLAGNGVSLFASPVGDISDSTLIKEIMTEPAKAGLMIVPLLNDSTGTRQTESAVNGNIQSTLSTLMRLMGDLDPAGYGIDIKAGVSVFNTVQPRTSLYRFAKTGGSACNGTGSVLTVTGNDAFDSLHTEFVIPGRWTLSSDERRIRAIPWWCYFSGLRRFWWNNVDGSVTAAITPQGSLSPALSLVSDEMKTIGSGIDLLLSGTGVVPNPGDAGLLVTDGNGASLAGTRTAVYRDDRSLFIGVALDPSVDAESLPTACTIVSENRRIRGFAYDLRSGTYLGTADTLNVGLDQGASIIAILPYRIQNINLTLSAPIITPDMPIGYLVTVTPSGDEQPGRHVASVEIVDGTGRKVLYSGVVLLKDGYVRGSVRLPMMGVGTLRMIVTDLVSGKRAERSIIIRESSVQEQIDIPVDIPDIP